jgi:hypothetical protein
MKRFAYLLTLLLLSAQADDALAAVCNLPPDPLADVNDEYLPSQWRAREERPTPDQAPAVAEPRSRAADVPPVRKGVPSGWNRITPFTPPPLYVFMSLQN